MGAARAKYFAVVSMFQDTSSSLRSIMWELWAVRTCRFGMMISLADGRRPEQRLAMLLEVGLVGLEHACEED